MDISAFFAPASLGASGVPPNPENPAAGSDGFAAIFASLVADSSAPSVPQTAFVLAPGEIPEIASPKGTPLVPLAGNVIPADAWPEGTTESPAPPGCPVAHDDEKVGAAVETPADETPGALPQRDSPAVARTGKRTLKAFPGDEPALPRRRPLVKEPTGDREARIFDPPPETKAETPEKEAPTNAPNAPVPPLDPTSEIAPDAVTPLAALPPTQAGPAGGGSARQADRFAMRAQGTPPTADVPQVGIDASANGERSAPVSNAPASASAPFQILASAPDLGLGTPVVRAFSEPDESLAIPATQEDRSFDALPSAFAVPTVENASRDSAKVAPVSDPASASGGVDFPRASSPDVAKIVPSLGESSGSALGEAVATSLGRTDHAADDGSEDAPRDDSPEAPPTIPPLAVRSAATEKPEAGADRPAIDRHLVVRQVAERIENLVAARPKDGVTIHLEPRDLGTITLVVKGLSSALDVQLAASDERVQKGLDASRPELAQALAPRGIELRELRVAYAPTPSGGSSMGGDHPQRGTNPEDRPRPQTPSFVIPSRRTAPSSRPLRASGRGVDLFV